MMNKEIGWITIPSLQQRFSELGTQDAYIYMPYINLAYYPSEPSRSRFYGIGLLHKGYIDFYTDLRLHQITSPAIIITDTNSIKRWNKQGENYEMESLLFSEEFLIEKHNPSSMIKILSNLSSLGGFVSSLEFQTYRDLTNLFQVIHSQDQSKQVFHKEIIRGVTYSIVCQIGQLDSFQTSLLASPNRLEKRFKQAVYDCYLKERSVRFYADLLNVHPKYLSQVISKQTGITAREWIQNLVILEAKILLQNDQVSIAEIAEKLNFPDQSTFGKYFKKYNQVSPREYRKKIR